MSNFDAHFDAQQVVNAVRSGTAPETWRVFRAQRRYFYVTGIGLAIIALLIFVGTGVFAYSDVTTPDQGPPCLIFGVGLLGAGLAATAIYFFGQLPIADEQWLAVTPNGFVDYRGQKRGVASAIAFRTLDVISLRVSHSRHSSSVSMSLDLKYKPIPGESWRRQPEWTIDQRFGRQEDIAQAIIEAHARYRAAGATLSE